MERLAALIESGEVVPSIGQRFALDDVAPAMRQMEAGALARQGGGRRAALSGAVPARSWPATISRER